jgi:hypothetical protein
MHGGVKLTMDGYKCDLHDGRLIELSFCKSFVALSTDLIVQSYGRRFDLALRNEIHRRELEVTRLTAWGKDVFNVVRWLVSLAFEKLLLSLKKKQG